MKMLKYILSAWLVSFTILQAQPAPFLNSSYIYSPHVVYNNPAALPFIGQQHASAGMEFLHMGLPGDNLRNNFASLVYPLSNNTAVGLQASYFTSNIFQSGQYGILFSQKIFKEYFALGLKASMLSYSYNEDEFVLFDYHDPVYQKGTGINVFSGGISFLAQPIDGFFIGVGLDNANEPDISIEESDVVKDQVLTAGLSTTQFWINPALDYRKEGELAMIQAGARVPVLPKKLNIFGGFLSMGDKGSAVIGQAEMKFGDLGIWYNFQHTLTDNFAALSSGSHQFGIFYTRTGVAAVPEIYLQEQSIKQVLPDINLLGSVTCSDGIQKIEIYNNDRLIGQINGKNKASINIKLPLTLKEGENRVRVVAFTVETSSDKEIGFLFEPMPPTIQINSNKNSQISTSKYTLNCEASDLIGLEKLRIWLNEQPVVDKKFTSKQNQVALQEDILLSHGRNNIYVEAGNKWTSVSDSLWIYYLDAEIPPEVVVTSPQSPVSSQSKIELNIDLENYQNLESIEIKLNGKTINNYSVDEIHQKFLKTKGGGFIRDRKIDDAMTIDLMDAKNHIEVIALDSVKAPRASRSMEILYNPHAEDMQFRKKKAFIIGIDDYKDTAITDLSKAVSDAKLVQKVLKDDFAFDQVEVLYNEQATLEKIQTFLSDSLYAANSQDFIVFYFSGHGDKITNDQGEGFGFLLPHDASPKSISKRIEMSALTKAADMSPAKNILFIIDACFSGEGIRWRPPVNMPNKECLLDYDKLNSQLNRRVRNMITAGKSNELAIDGLFTRHLINALKGAADCNKDFYISFTELGSYLQYYVPEEASRKYGNINPQHPQVGALSVIGGENVFYRKK